MTTKLEKKMRTPATPQQRRNFLLTAGLLSTLLGVVQSVGYHPFEAGILTGLGIGILAFVGGEIIKEWKQKRKRDSAQKTLEIAEDEKAVSPVIGVVLMVAITMVLAAVVFVLVQGLKGTPPTNPHVSLESTPDGNFTVLSAELGLSWSDFTAEPCTQIPTGTVAAGDKIGGCNGKITLIYKPGNSVIYRKE